MKRRSLLVTICLTFAGIFLSPAIAFARDFESLNGTWVADAKATELSILNMTPLNLPDDFVMTTHWLIFGIYEVEGEVLSVGAYNSSKKTKFRLVSRQSNELKYVELDGAEPRKYSFTISICDEKHIRIASSNLPSMFYMLWKKVDKVDPIGVPLNEIEAHINSWMTAYKNIQQTVDASKLVNVDK